MEQASVGLSAFAKRYFARAVHFSLADISRTRLVRKGVCGRSRNQATKKCCLRHVESRRPPLMQRIAACHWPSQEGGKQFMLVNKMATVVPQSAARA